MAIAHHSPGPIALWSAVFNTGVGCVFATVPNLVIAAAGAHETGEATGVNTIAGNVGASLGGQVAAWIRAAHVLADGAPRDRGFQLAFLSAAIVTLAAGLAGVLLPTPKPARRTALPAALAAARG